MNCFVSVLGSNLLSVMSLCVLAAYTPACYRCYSQIVRTGRGWGGGGGISPPLGDKIPFTCLIEVIRHMLAVSVVFDVFHSVTEGRVLRVVVVVYTTSAIPPLPHKTLLGGGVEKGG